MKKIQTQEKAEYPHISISLDDFEELDHTPGIGMIAPFDFALDAECWRWLPEHTPLFLTRTPYLENTAVTVDLAKEVSDEKAIIEGVKSLSAAMPASIAYACTSGSFVLGRKGERHLRKIMKQAGAQSAVTASGSLVSALEHLGVKNVAIATPYNSDLTTLLGAYLRECGYEVVSSGYLNKEERIARISYDAVRKLAKAVDHPSAEAIFFSCTNLRTFDIIEELEQLLGKPVLSANQVMMWAALRSANLPLPNLNQSLFKRTVETSALPASKINSSSV